MLLLFAMETQTLKSYVLRTGMSSTWYKIAMPRVRREQYAIVVCIQNHAVGVYITTMIF